MTKQDLTQIKDVVREVVKDEITKELKPIHKKLNKLEKKIDTTINFFDHEVLSDRKRIDRIENHLGISQKLSL